MLRSASRLAGPDALAAHWPGTPEGLAGLRARRMTRGEPESLLAWTAVQGKFLSDGDCQAPAAAAYEAAGGWGVGLVRSRTGRWAGPLGPGGASPRTRQSLVPRRSMGPGLGQRLQLGLESLPRLARSAGPKWPRGLGAVGSPAGLGAAAAAPTTVGARGSADVEPDCEQLGILEQRNMDSGLT